MHKSLKFSKRQVNQLVYSRFHYSVLVQKAFTLVTPLVVVMVLPIIAIIRILRPIIHIRFYSLLGSRIGHFTANPEMYMCERDLGMHERVFDIFHCGLNVCNHQLVKMYKRVLNIYQFSSVLYKANRLLPGYEDYEVMLDNPFDPVQQYRDVNDYLIKSLPHVWFSPEEECKGQKSLKEMGIPEGAPFICFHVRDSSYLDNIHPENDWSYHNHRDCCPNNYISAMDYVVNSGCYAIRMGAIVKEKLNNSNPRIIDYATKYRTDFLDIYLLSKCNYFIGSTSGLTNATYQLFRKPIVWTNFIPIGLIHSWNANSLVIPKKLWLRSEKRFVKIREIFDMEIGNTRRLNQYEQLGIELVENTHKEIKDLVIEMDERFNGTWKTTEEDEKLQRRFWDIFPDNHKHKYHGEIRARIGAEFLRQNKELLD